MISFHLPSSAFSIQKKDQNAIDIVCEYTTSRKELAFPSSLAAIDRRSLPLQGICFVPLSSFPSFRPSALAHCCAM